MPTRSRPTTHRSVEILCVECHDSIPVPAPTLEGLETVTCPSCGAQREVAETDAARIPRRDEASPRGGVSEEPGRDTVYSEFPDAA